MFIITNASIRNNITISITYIQRKQKVITKLAHHATNVNFMKAELFTIRYRINHAMQLQDISHIIVIIDTISLTKEIFDIFIHLYQLHSIVVSKDLKIFFNKNIDNIIKFLN